MKASSQSQIIDLPHGMLALLQEAEQFTYNLIKTQQQLLDDDNSRPRDSSSVH